MKTETITRIGIVATEVVTTEAEALKAARAALDWNGSSEADSPAEMTIVEPDEDSGRWTAWYVWGCESNRSDAYSEPEASFATEAEAEAFVNAHNEKALADWARVEWIELPKPVSDIYFDRCGRGNYPQSRIATITARVAGADEDIEVSGFGNAPFLRDTHSPAALANAVEKLVEALAE